MSTEKWGWSYLILLKFHINIYTQTLRLEFLYYQSGIWLLKENRSFLQVIYPKNWRSSVDFVQLCLSMCCSNIRSYTRKVSATWLPKHGLKKDSTSGHAQIDEETPMKPQHYPKNFKELRETESGRGGRPQGAHTNLLPNAKLSSLRTCTQITLYRLSTVYLGTYVYIYIYIHMQ